MPDETKPGSPPRRFAWLRPPAGLVAPIGEYVVEVASSPTASSTNARLLASATSAPAGGAGGMCNVSAAGSRSRRLHGVVGSVAPLGASTSPRQASKLGGSHGWAEVPDHSGSPPGAHAGGVSAQASASSASGFDHAAARPLGAGYTPAELLVKRAAARLRGTFVFGGSGGGGGDAGKVASSRRVRACAAAALCCVAVATLVGVAVWLSLARTEGGGAGGGGGGAPAVITPAPATASPPPRLATPAVAGSALLGGYALASFDATAQRLFTASLGQHLQVPQTAVTGA